MVRRLTLRRMLDGSAVVVVVPRLTPKRVLDIFTVVPFLTLKRVLDRFAVVQCLTLKRVLDRFAVVQCLTLKSVELYSGSALGTAENVG